MIITKLIDYSDYYSLHKALPSCMTVFRTAARPGKRGAGAGKTTLQRRRQIWFDSAWSKYNHQPNSFVVDGLLLPKKTIFFCAATQDMFSASWITKMSAGQHKKTLKMLAYARKPEEENNKKRPQSSWPVFRTLAKSLPNWFYFPGLFFGACATGLLPKWLFGWKLSVCLFFLLNLSTKRSYPVTFFERPICVIFFPLYSTLKSTEMQERKNYYK